MNAFPAGFTFNTLSAFPDTDDKPVPPLAIGNVPDVIAVPAFIFATLNVPKVIISTVSPLDNACAKTTLVPDVTVKITGGSTTVNNNSGIVNAHQDVVAYFGEVHNTGTIISNEAEVVHIHHGNFYSSGADATNVHVSGQAFVTGTEVDPAIFSKTGSFVATSNDTQITGSLALRFDGSGDTFKVNVNGSEKLEINTEGTVIYKPLATAPTYTSGGLFFSSSGDFYVGG